ncbi:MAG: hypothetical protein MHM6MM_003278 [Cercozoa sp. M6MM]
MSGKEFDVELDITSPLFDAEKTVAAREQDVRIPLPRHQAHRLDNLTKCRFLLPEDDPNYLDASSSSNPFRAPTRAIKEQTHLKTVRDRTERDRDVILHGGIATEKCAST